MAIELLRTLADGLWLSISSLDCTEETSRHPLSTLCRVDAMNQNNDIQTIPESNVEALDNSDSVDALFEEVDLFSTALIQGGCTNDSPEF